MVEPDAIPSRYAVYCPGRVEPLVIAAENWVFALGAALERVDAVDWVSRLSCEIHPDGTVVAEDRVTGLGYVVQRVREPGRGAAREHQEPHAAERDGADAWRSHGARGAANR